MLKENILRPIMVRSINKFGSFASSDQVDIVTGVLVNNLSCFNRFQPFPNRICSIRWIPRRPNALLVGGKHGELCLVPDVSQYTISGNDQENVDMISNGIGPGGEIRELIVDENDNHMFYSLNVSGELVKVDINTNDINVLQPQGNFNVWYGGLAIHFDRKAILMGDNKGYIHILPDSTRSGKISSDQIRIHEPGKINHIGFHPRDTNLMTTSATSDKCVKLWDIRNLKEMEPIKTLEHSRGVNSCYFNRAGHKMVTTDQGNEIRIYSSGDWKHITTIFHPHRQFQYLVPIRAEWHPLADLIVVGRYPNESKGQRAVDFFDGRDGATILSLDTQVICSYNRFNYTGDILASMSQTEITIWRQKMNNEKPMREPVKNHIKRKKDTSDDDDDDDEDSEEDFGKKKSKRAINRGKNKKVQAKKKLPEKRKKNEKL